jgi:rod shape determining protein RodA
LQARLWRNFDIILLVTTLVLIVFGVAMVQSATLRYGSTFPSLDSLATRQAIFAVIGLGAMFLMARVDYRFIETFTLPLYVLVLLLLGAIFALGYVSGGAQRWFDLGFTNLQPSELAKMVVVLTLAKLLADREGKINSPINVLISGACVIVPVVLIYLQPDMGTSLVVGAIWLGMMYAIGLRWFYWVGGIVLSVPAGFVAWNFLLHDYMRDRFLIFLNPESDPLGQGYNILQARISIGSGGWFGRGYGSGIQSQLHYLRVPHTDFIFSVISEEFGFFGAIFLCLLLLILVWRHFKIAETAADTYGKLIAVGIGSWLLFQVFVNIGMNLGMMPVTGIPLPFISYGGSSLLTILICEGIVQSVAMRHTKSLF